MKHFICNDKRIRLISIGISPVKYCYECDVDAVVQQLIEQNGVTPCHISVTIAQSIIS